MRVRDLLNDLAEAGRHRLGHLWLAAQFQGDDRCARDLRAHHAERAAFYRRKCARLRRALAAI